MQLKFINEYGVKLQLTAKIAGYSAETAAIQGSQLLEIMMFGEQGER